MFLFALYRQEMLQLLAESCDGSVEKKVADTCIHPAFNHLLVSILCSSSGLFPNACITYLVPVA